MNLYAIFPFLALFGFFASVVIHLAACFGQPIPDAAMLLHFGVFVVFFPAVGSLKMKGARGGIEAMRACPPVVLLGVLSLLVYCSVNFFTQVGEGQEALVESFRLFSGHWMFFYFVSYAILITAKRLNAQPR